MLRPKSRARWRCVCIWLSLRVRLQLPAALIVYGKYANDFLEAGGVCRKHYGFKKAAMHMAYWNQHWRKDRKEREEDGNCGLRSQNNNYVLSKVHGHHNIARVACGRVLLWSKGFFWCCCCSVRAYLCASTNAKHGVRRVRRQHVSNNNAVQEKRPTTLHNFEL